MSNVCPCGANNRTSGFAQQTGGARCAPPSAPEPPQDVYKRQLQELSDEMSTLQTLVNRACDDASAASSDLSNQLEACLLYTSTQYEGLTEYFKGDTAIALSPEDPAAAARIQIGRASCRERVCQYV